MSILELFRSALMALPKETDERGVAAFLRAVFEEYQRALATLAGDVGQALQARQTAIAVLCNSLLRTLDTFDETDIEPAVASFAEGIEAVRPDLLHVADCNENSVLLGQSLYRLRKSAKPLTLRRDLFHVPFALRHVLPHLRYSVRASPCLYLANSVYTGWKECRFNQIERLQPEETNQIYAARFELAPGTRVLDLCYPPHAVEMALAHYEDPVLLSLGLGTGQLMHAPFGSEAAARTRYLCAYLSVWPLLAATSLRVAGETDGIKPEYIVPQVLMNWVQRSSDFAGVRYFSTREVTNFSSHDHAIDWAFPAKAEGDAGYCEFLRSIFLCTEPWSFARLAEIDAAGLVGEEDVLLAEKKFRRYEIRDEDGMWHYFGTPYCNMEYALHREPVERIEDAAGVAS